MSWQEAFKGYATGTAFSLALSKNQAECLTYIAAGRYDEWNAASGWNVFVPTSRGLARRGLIEHNPVCLVRMRPGHKAKWVYRATPAGLLVLQLMALAGVENVCVPKKEKAA